jgi:hypothetical protein
MTDAAVPNEVSNPAEDDAAVPKESNPAEDDAAVPNEVSNPAEDDAAVPKESNPAEDDAAGAKEASNDDEDDGADDVGGGETVGKKRKRGGSPRAPRWTRKMERTINQERRISTAETSRPSEQCAEGETFTGTELDQLERVMATVASEPTETADDDDDLLDGRLTATEFRRVKAAVRQLDPTAARRLQPVHAKPRALERNGIGERSGIGGQRVVG